MCGPVKPVDVAPLVAALADIHARLDSSGNTVALVLKDVTVYGRRATRVVSTVQAENSGITAETRFAVQRTG
jgi:hypothetical protein